MDGEFDRWRGWRRWGLHFFGFGIIPILIAVSLYLCGGSENWLILSQYPAIAVGCLLIFWMEFKDLHEGANGWRKGLLDVISKCLGWTLGVLSWGGWWA